MTNLLPTNMLSAGRKRVMSGRQAHWDNVYATKDEHAVSWFQEKPDISLDLIRATGVKATASIIDIGGGASRLVDALLHEGFKAVTVLDLSEKALATSKARLDARGAHVQWVAADVTTWMPSQTYDVWHDRAALHFLTDPKDRDDGARAIDDVGWRRRRRALSPTVPAGEMVFFIPWRVVAENPARRISTCRLTRTRR